MQLVCLGPFFGGEEGGGVYLLLKNGDKPKNMQKQRNPF